jgi:hypothetical protein
VLELVILGAIMSLGHEMLLTEQLCAVIAFERKEVDKVAILVRAAFANI